jgi:YfiH family protein
LSSRFITPNWPAPRPIHAFTTTRHGGVSLPPYDSFNLSEQVGDNLNHVQQNRKRLIQIAHLPESPRWLSQCHGTEIIDSQYWTINHTADGIFANHTNHVCAVMTADCLPVLICDKNGQQVAAVHAGWRGLASGIVEQAVAKFDGDRSHLLVWLGPAIGPEQFEVGHDVVRAFSTEHPEAKQAFKQTDSLHFMADIYLLARQRLHALGITAIYGGEYCTITDSDQFFSYRRQMRTGRMTSMIWIAST